MSKGIKEQKNLRVVCKKKINYQLTVVHKEHENDSQVTLTKIHMFIFW